MEGAYDIEYSPTQCWGEGVVNGVITVLTLTVKVIYQRKWVHSGITEVQFGAYKLLRKPQASPIVNKGEELEGEKRRLGGVVFKESTSPV